MRLVGYHRGPLGFRADYLERVSSRPVDCALFLATGLPSRLLARRGLVQVVEKHEVSAENIARAVDRAMETRRLATPPIDTRGAERSVEILKSAVAARLEQ